jgi:hypothetical protein
MGVMPSDLELIRTASLLRTRSIYGLMSLAANIKVQPHALEDFISKGKPLPASAMISLVSTLFHNRARWDPETGALANVVQVPSPMMDTSAMPPTAINTSPP